MKDVQFYPDPFEDQAIRVKDQSVNADFSRRHHAASATWAPGSGSGAG